MSDRIGYSNRFATRYLVDRPTKDVREVENSVEKYKVTDKLWAGVSTIAVILLLLVLGYIMFRYNATRAAMAFAVAIVVGIIAYHLSGTIYSIKPFYKHLYKDA